MITRGFHDDPALLLSDADVSVIPSIGVLDQLLVSLKSKNAKHLRKWTVERSTSTANKRSRYAIFFKDTLVGEVTLRDFSALSCQISYWIDKKHQKKGISTTAVRLLSEYALARLNVLEIVAYVHVSNAPSIRVLEKAGYEHVDTTVKNMFYADVSAPHLMYTYDRFSM